MSHVPLVYKAAAIYIIRTVTPIHAGMGRSVAEVADLPIQRDGRGYPVIYGSSIKGALRAAFRAASGSLKTATTLEKKIFGPEREDTQKFAGALTVLDAVLIAIPAPSLYGGYAYIVPPYGLEALLDYYSVAKSLHSKTSEGCGADLERIVSKVLSEARELGDGECLVGKGSSVVASEKGKRRASVAGRDLVARDSEAVDELEKLLSEYSKLDMDGRVVVPSPKNCIDLANAATEIVTRVALDYAKKTVRPGALWTEEYLPRNSLLVTLLLMADARDGGGSADSLMEELRKKVLEKRYIMLGGHETIGKGVVEFLEVKVCR